MPKLANQTSPSAVDHFLSAVHTHDSRVSLAALDDQHTEQLLQIGFQPEIWRFARYPKNDADSFKRYFNKVLARKDSINFAILSAFDGQVVGFTRLKAIDKQNQTAEMGTWLVPDAQAKGYNEDIKRELLAVAFLHLNLDLVYCYVNPDNQPSIKSLQKLGFSPMTQRNRVSLNSEGDAVFQLYFCFTRQDYKRKYRTAFAANH